MVSSVSTDAAELAAEIGVVHGHCAVYTVPRVAEAILDRVGWVDQADLLDRTLLEPSCGDGAFLVPAIRRLLASARRQRLCHEERLLGRIRAFEFDRSTANATRAKVRALLLQSGLSRDASKRIAATWIRADDFLLARDLPEFSDVVGNPPYMRWSKLPPGLRARYEEQLPKHAAKGDLCLAFVCRAVELLQPKAGRVAFLCADRWLRCAYGSAARCQLNEAVRLVQHLEVRDVPVFAGSRKVDAYAAITVLERDRFRDVVVSRATSMDDLCAKLRPQKVSCSALSGPSGSRMTGRGGAVLVEAQLASAFDTIVANGHPLRDVGVSVRCGMALGRAATYVIDNVKNVAVEPDRLVPWIRTADLAEDGTVTPSASYIDVWGEDGELVSLVRFPLLGARLRKDRRELAKRACVRNRSEWYRTIDKSHRELLPAPKILVAGLSKFARVGMSPGGAQPSNALYAITSTQWPLQSLFALFRCGLLDLFATVLAPRFAGDVKRFDGNLLRQVRLPRWSDVDESLRMTISNLETRRATPRPEVLGQLFGVSDVTHLEAISRAISRQ